MGGFQAYQCRGCATACVDPIPSADTLRHYYAGFAFAADPENLELYRTPPMRAWLHSLGLPAGSQMLDVGGGGGFMARVFQDWGFGEAHYVDLDPAACDFARQHLGLQHVIHADVCSLAESLPVKYAFIHCRHVLEHVPDPFEMLQRLTALLAPGGVLVLVLPNGGSLEYVGYPSMLRRRVETIVADNPGHPPHLVWWWFLAGRIAHGLDPVRHLWAITPSGLASWLSKRSDIRFVVSTKPLSHPVFSMYNAARRRRTLRDRFQTFVVNRTLGRVRGGCHLVAEIRCDSPAHSVAGVPSVAA